MGRKCTVPLVLALLSLAFTSCDFLRSVAGRPTSEIIEAKRIALEEEAAAAEAAATAAEAARRHTEDSLAAERYIAENCLLTEASKIRSLDASTLRSRYAIIVGAFSQEGNAESFASRLGAMGYDTGIIGYSNGHKVVGICLTDDIIALAQTYEKFRTEKICPPEVWILVNDR